MLLPIGAGALAIAIFVIDTITTLDIAVAVLYVAVVLMAANFLQRRGLIMVAAGCLGLTVISYVISHGFTADDSLLRCAVSLSAIGITAFLALKNQSATAALREQAQLLDLTHDTIFVRDAKDVITYWNRGAEQLYGWPREQAVGRVAHDLMQTVFPLPLETITAELLSTGRWEGDLVHTKRDGTPIWVSSRWSLQRNERGQVASILETNTDITERNKAQEALQQAHAQLAHVTRMATIGELTASIAHEVNQPLAAVVTNGEACRRWLGRKVPQLDEAQANVDRMIREARRASDVIARLRALFKKADPEKGPLDINEIIDEVIPLVRREVVNHRVILRLELAPALPPVLGDRTQIQQVIINLMVNSIQAMSSVGDRPRELLVRSQRHEADQLLVEVRDSGIGIDPDHAAQLFGAFFTTKPEGMGMGLSISRSIIEAHGGRIWASRNAGPGATFQFSLPLLSPPSSVIPAGRSESRNP